MADRITKEQRSKNMSAVKSKNTKPELLVRHFFHKHGLRYSLHVRNLPGKPDIVLKKYNIAVFINGCYWHGHGCKKSTLPKINKEFWSEKIKKNIQRDKVNINILLGLGWKVMLIWECKINYDFLDKCVKNIKSNYMRKKLSANFCILRQSS